MYTKLVDRVADMLEDSLRYSEKKLGKAGAIMELLKKNDANAHSYFRYWLAKQVGIYLGETSEHVLEVFIYPEMLVEEISATLPLTLIVYVEVYTAALESIVDALQNALLAEYQTMFSPSADGLSFILNIYFVDKDDFLRRKALSAAIGSLHTPAIRVWNRFSD